VDTAATVSEELPARPGRLTAPLSSGEGPEVDASPLAPDRFTG
jgi:hypothetical protein